MIYVITIQVTLFMPNSAAKHIWRNGQGPGLLVQFVSLQILTSPEGSVCQVDSGNMWDRMTGKEQALFTTGLYVWGYEIC